MTISLRIELFGGFDIALATGEPLKLHQPRLQQLLAFLLLNRQQPQSRRYIAFIFWPDSSEKQALANLRKLLHMLGQIVPELPRFLEITTTTMQWRQDAPAQVDIVEFENNLPLGQADGKRVDLSELEQAVNLYRGDLLPHFYDDWLIAPRQQLRERQIAALTALIERYEDKREYQRALQWTKRLQQQIPLQEAVYQRLMRLHLLLGDRAAALQAFHQCATLLAEELGVEPGPAIKQLHQRVLQQDELIQTENLPDEPDRLPLAGRIREWRQLQEAWQTAQEGLASMVLVQGEAGIGKTRLAEELVESNRKLGHRVIQTRAYAATDSGAFAPIVDLLRLPQVYAFLQTLDDVWMVEVSRLIPELKATRPALPGPIPMEEPWQQHRFHEAITRCLLGSGQPLLLHFDDLQWCDAASLAWLQFLLEFDRRAPLLVVGTVRNDEIEPTHPLMRLHHQLRRHQRSLSIELQPLSLEATAQLVSSAIGFYPEPTVTNALFGESAGNPLFALELMRSGRFSPETDLTETQQNAEQDRGQLPAKIDAVIRWRLDQLSPDARYLAATAAVIGHSFTQKLLQTASEISESEIVQGLDELWRRRIIREHGEAAFDFSHDYIRDVATGLVSPIQRRHLHRRIAEALQTESRASSYENSAQIADHYLGAGTPTEARPFLERAGDLAASRYADEEALALYGQALSHWPEEDEGARFRLHCKRETIFAKLIVAEDWRKELNQMATAAEKILAHDPESVGPIVETAIRNCRYERLILQNVDISRLEEALRLARKHNELVLEVRVLTVIGDVSNHGGYDLSARYLAEAIRLAEANALEAEAADAYEKIAPAFLFRGAPEGEVKTYLQKALAYAERAGNLRRQAIGHDKLGYLAFYHGEAAPEQSIAAISRALELAQEIGDAEYEVIFAGNLGRAYTIAGQYDLAQQSFELAIQRAQHNSFNGWREKHRGHFGSLLTEMGDFAGARHQFEVSLDKLTDAYISNDFGWLEFVTGRFERALHHYRQSLIAATEVGDIRLEGSIRKRKGQLLTTVGRYAEAEAHLKQARHLHLSIGQSNRATMAEAGLADLALKRGDLLLACEHVEAILNHLQRMRLQQTDESLFVYISAFRVLQAAQDDRAAAMLRMAKKQLIQRAATITDEGQHTAFWAAKPHAEVINAAI